MFNDTLRAFLEGRGSLTSVERAISASKNELRARAEVERELALEWALKDSFATIPAPPRGLKRVQEALAAAPAPVVAAEAADDLEALQVEFQGSFARMPEPEGGFAAAIERLKCKLAVVLAPQTEVLDIAPCFDEQPAPPRLVKLERKKSARLTRILRLPQQAQQAQQGWVRDVLAAGKDLPENPEDLPPDGDGK